MSDALMIFARQPVPGRVKTRLAGDLGPETAALIYSALLDHTIDVALESGTPSAISCAERPEQAWVSGLALDCEIQSRGDLGERMRASFERSFSHGADRVLIIGSDNARIRASHIGSAMESLDDHRVVLGPARDGGYWLVGQRAPGVDLFTGVRWSSRETMKVTRQRLTTLGIAWHELETLPDIDTAADLERALQDVRVPADLRERLTRAAESCHSERA